MADNVDISETASRIPVGASRNDCHTIEKAGSVARQHRRTKSLQKNTNPPGTVGLQDMPCYGETECRWRAELFPIFSPEDRFELQDFKRNLQLCTSNAVTSVVNCDS